MTKHGIVKNVRGASEEAKGQSEIRPQTKKRKKRKKPRERERGKEHELRTKR
jgi:DNA/RNA endonuclease YhcR with UshA esterase domain